MPDLRILHVILYVLVVILYQIIKLLNVSKCKKDVIGNKINFDRHFVYVCK